MSEGPPALPPRLQRIVEEFRGAEGRDKLNLLLAYSASMPKASDALKSQPGKFEAVDDCTTPLFVHAESRDGKMAYTFDVPEVSPTVRGFAAILGLGLKDVTPEQVLQTPGDVFHQMNFHKLLTPQRMHESAALLVHIKRLARRELDASGR
jgi:cysteine desulfuration protein SufE